MWDLIKEKRLNKNSKTRKIRNCGFGAQIFFLKKKNNIQLYCKKCVSKKDSIFLHK